MNRRTIQYYGTGTREEFPKCAECFRVIVRFTGAVCKPCEDAAKARRLRAIKTIAGDIAFGVFIILGSALFLFLGLK